MRPEYIILYLITLTCVFFEEKRNCAKNVMLYFSRRKFHLKFLSSENKENINLENVKI